MALINGIEYTSEAVYGKNWLGPDSLEPPHSQWLTFHYVRREYKDGKYQRTVLTKVKVNSEYIADILIRNWNILGADKGYGWNTYKYEKVLVTT